MRYPSYEKLSIERAETAFHYTTKYRYTKTTIVYKVKGYMIVNKFNPVATGAVYKTPAEAEKALAMLKAVLRSELKARDAEQLTIVPYEMTEVETHVRNYKLGKA